MTELLCSQNRVLSSTGAAPALPPSLSAWTPIAGHDTVLGIICDIRKLQNNTE
ncbi:GH11749 [Drosophila grimshawi]|uniref:GH11749 n=1 Tax=Drosophila grimshawi TaxID=7222 RepID=B4K3U0_DROGR|nr:GH11749 [Drosophila grimshawi]